MRKYFTRQAVIHYLYTEVLGNFIGFLIGMSATGLVSRFFETRSIKNLWGLAAKKTVVDRNTFTTLEWIISILVGFIVFEIVTKVIGEWIHRNYPHFKFKTIRWIVSRGLHDRVRKSNLKVSKIRVMLLSSVNRSLTRKISRK